MGWIEQAKKNPVLIKRLKSEDHELIYSLKGYFIKAIDSTRDGITKGTQRYGEIREALSKAMRFSPLEMIKTFSASQGMTDVTFDDMDELDAVHYVGGATINRLEDFVVRMEPLTPTCE